MFDLKGPEDSASLFGAGEGDIGDLSPEHTDLNITNDFIQVFGQRLGLQFAGHRSLNRKLIVERPLVAYRRQERNSTSKMGKPLLIRTGLSYAFDWIVIMYVRRPIHRLHY